MYLDYYIMGIILLPAIILGIIAQIKVNTTYTTYSKMLSTSGKTAAQIARLLLDSAGLQHIDVVKVRGELTDHFDPKKQVVALSSGVYNSTSVAAIGIAAHEVGHAVQYKEKYFPIKLRNKLVPITNIASTILWPLVFLGLLLNFGYSSTGSAGMVFVWSGIILFGLTAIFNIVTLPVEFNASNRAIRVLYKTQIFNAQETAAAKKVLSAAALTYVAATLVSILNLVRFLLVVSNDR